MIGPRAAEKGMAFLIAGGHAVIAHGHPRNTFDLDLIVPRTDRENWIALVCSAGYRLYREGPTFVQFDPLNQEALPVDLMLVNDETFNKLMTAAVALPGQLASAKIVSLKHLLALKCHAIKHGHSGRIVKDVDDVINLVTANAVDVSEPEMRALFLKHGTRELYEKIQRVCKGP